MSDTLKRKVAEQIALDMDMDGDEADILYCEMAAENAIATIRAEALEEAAKIVDEWQRNYTLESCCDAAQEAARMSIAAAIRALEKSNG